MKRALIIFPFLLLLLGQLFAIEKLYQAGTIVDVQQKVNTRVLYYIVNTPITKDEPYYEVSVQIKDTVYLGRYMPRHADDTLPEEWIAGAAVQARIEKRNLFIKRPSGSDVQFVIYKESAAKTGTPAPQPAPAPK